MKRLKAATYLSQWERDKIRLKLKKPVVGYPFTRVYEDGKEGFTGRGLRRYTQLMLEYGKILREAPCVVTPVKCEIQALSFDSFLDMLGHKQLANYVRALPKRPLPPALARVAARYSSKG